VSLDRDAPAPAWWATQRVRLPVLLVCLCGALAGLLGSSTSLLSRLGGGSGASAEGASTRCAPPGLPEPAGAGIAQLVELRADLIAATPRAGRRYAGGIFTPADIWSDDEPQRLRSSRLPDGRWPAGYELRWWTPLYDTVADVLVFSGSRQARAFFQAAASTRCHRAGVSRTPAFPPQARGLAWVNPDDAQQEDVFLLRGASVYRVAVVRLARTPAVARHVDFEFAAALACGLPAAGCSTTALVV
jgi:hypothetical protein